MASLLKRLLGDFRLSTPTDTDGFIIGISFPRLAGVASRRLTQRLNGHLPSRRRLPILKPIVIKNTPSE